MKVLLLSQGRCIEDQISFHDALSKATFNGEPIELYNFPFVGYVIEHGCEAFYDEVVRINGEFEPDVVFFQHFHYGAVLGDPSRCISKLKAASNHPMVIGSLGDLFQNSFRHLWRRPLPISVVGVATAGDAFFTTSMGVNAEYLVRRGAKNVVFLPLAHIWQNFPDWNEPVVEKKEFDIVMVGSIPAMTKSNPFGSVVHSLNRKKVADILWRRYGKRFALFGNRWGRHPACLGPLPFKDQMRLFKRSLITVDSPAPYSELYYASNRPFIAAGSGSLLVQYHTPRFESVLKDGEHVNFIDSHKSLVSACDALLNGSAAELQRRSRTTVDYIYSHQTREARVDTILSVVDAILRCRAGQITSDEALRQVRFNHFHSGVDLNVERAYCVANWCC